MTGVQTCSSDLTIPPFLALIKSLAAFEKEPDAVFATEELLRRNLGFDEASPDTKYVQCVLAYVGGAPEDGGECVAMACYL